MTNKNIGVFDASLIYHDLAIYFELPGTTPSLKHRCAIAYLIEKECYVEFSITVNKWYRYAATQMQQYNFNQARKSFHECFDYFLLASMNFENVYLTFSGNYVFVSNFEFDIKSLNKKS